MKRFLSVLLACSVFALSSTAGEVQRLALPSGRSAVVKLPFASAGYKVSGDVADAVSISVEEGASTAVVSAGGKAGRCQITFRDAEGEECVVLLEVLDEIDELLPRLRKHLSGFDGLKVERAGARIAVSGTIGNSSDWGRFERILALAVFHGKVDNRVEFRIDTTELNALVERLRKAGVPVAEPGSPAPRGAVSINYEHNVLTLGGTVWSPEQGIAVRNVLRKTHWAKVVEASEVPNDSEFHSFVPTVISVMVADDSLRVSVALVCVDVDRFSGDGTPSVRSLRDMLDKGRLLGRVNSLAMDGSVTNIIADWTDAGAVVGKVVGSMVVQSGDPDSSRGILCKRGGTVTINPLSNDGSEEAADSKQVFDYGINLEHRGTRLLEENRAEVAFSLEVADRPEIKKDSMARQSRSAIVPTVSVDLGRPVVCSGYVGNSFSADADSAAARDLLALFRKEGWFDEPETSGSSTEPKNPAFLLVVGVERMEE